MKGPKGSVYRDRIQILLVDDERIFRNLLYRALSEEGYDVQPAESGKEAIELLKKGKYDLVITDINMPEVDGMEVTRIAKSIDPEIEVIIITGYASLDTALEAIRIGVYDYVVKPFQIEEIKLTTANAADKIRLMRQNRELLVKLNTAHQEIRELMSSHKENVDRFDEISASLEARGHELEEGLHSLINLQSRLLPFQYAYEEKHCMPVVDRVQRLVELKQKGFITEDDYRKMKEALLEDM